MKPNLVWCQINPRIVSNHNLNLVVPNKIQKSFSLRATTDIEAFSGGFNSILHKICFKKLQKFYETSFKKLQQEHNFVEALEVYNNNSINNPITKFQFTKPRT